MKFRNVTAAALMGIGTGLMAMTMHVTTALAAEPASQVEFGSTLPPIGFVRFCLGNSRDCDTVTTETKPLEMTPSRWRNLVRVNAIVNNQIEPVNDLVLYGEVERWVVPTDKGDCEDYVLLKRKILLSKGFPASALRITVVLDEQREGHAVLTVVSTTGDFILDNRTNDVQQPAQTKYTYLKRQSAGNPRAWVSLSRQEPRASGVVTTPVSSN
jgi:predicted transglutaminase-like cysteine proteinase